MPTVISRLFKGQKPAAPAPGGLANLRLLERLLREPSTLRRYRLVVWALRRGRFSLAIALAFDPPENGDARARVLAGAAAPLELSLVLEALGSRVSPLSGLDPAAPRWISLHEDPFRPGSAFLRKFNLASGLILPLPREDPGVEASRALLLASGEPLDYADGDVQELLALWSLYRTATAPGWSVRPEGDGALAPWGADQIWQAAPAALAILDGDDVVAVNPAAERLLRATVGSDGQGGRLWLAAAARRLQDAGREHEKLAASRARDTILAVDLGGVAEQRGGRRARLVAIRDATEEIRAQQRSAETISTISHELRTPLTTMKNSVGLLLRGEAGNQSTQAEHFLRMTMRNIDRLNRLISDLLDVSRAAAGRLDLHRQVVDLVPLLHEALEIFASTAAQRRISLTCDLGAESFPAHVDGDKVVQMVHNTVGNALKFTPEGGRVRIWLNQRPGGSVDAGARQIAERFFLPLKTFALVVEDNGVGMSEEVRANLFSPFARGGEPSVAAEPSSGLGLHITRTLVEAHGGRIALASGSGVGTTVWIVLPRDPDSERVLVATRRLRERCRRDCVAQTAFLDVRRPGVTPDAAELRRCSRVVREFVARLEDESDGAGTATAARGPIAELPAVSSAIPSDGRDGVEEPASGVWAATVRNVSRLSVAWEVERAGPGCPSVLADTAWELLELEEERDERSATADALMDAVSRRPGDGCSNPLGTEGNDA